MKEETIIDLDLKTEDNAKIKATSYRGNKEMPSVILLHMLDRNRKDWNNFAKSLQKNDSYSADSSQTLKSLSQSNVLKIYKGSEHGTRLFGNTDIDKVVIKWLEANLK